MFTCIHVCLVIIYLPLTNPYNHKIYVPTFTQTPFMYYDTSTLLNGMSLSIICLVCTLQNIFNNNFLIVYHGSVITCQALVL